MSRRDEKFGGGSAVPVAGAEERSDEAPATGASPSGAVPEPEVLAKPTRRQFTAGYRLRILEEADRCTDRGEVGRLLRREGLYSSHLSSWRKARREGALSGLSPKKRGRKPVEANPLMPKVKRLEATVKRLEKELAAAHALASPRFVDRSPAEVAATLLDEGRYLCSERTMYRILEANHPVRDRRNQRVHPSYAKPELVAEAPNQVWSWDITRLLGPQAWTYYYLYVLLDIFSRYAVGWMVADRENSALAQRLIKETCLKHGVEPDTLTLHSDRGSPMTAQGTAQLLARLGVVRSLGRPQVSDDNPYSEAQFKTLKYHPGFPDRFTGRDAATTFCRSFFPWYNTEHRHAGIAMLTPETVHYGRAQAALEQRQQVLREAWLRHPERFVGGRRNTLPCPEAVWINEPSAKTGETAH